MSDLNPKGTPYTLSGKTYNLIFSYNVVDDFQDHFDTSIAKLDDLINNPKTQLKVIKYILAALINDSIDLHNEDSAEKWSKIDERYIGRHLNSNDDFKNCIEAIKDVFVSSMPKKSDDEIPNA